MFRYLTSFSVNSIDSCCCFLTGLTFDNFTSTRVVSNIFYYRFKNFYNYFIFRTYFYNSIFSFSYNRFTYYCSHFTCNFIHIKCSCCNFTTIFTWNSYIRSTSITRFILFINNFRFNNFSFYFRFSSHFYNCFSRKCHNWFTTFFCNFTIIWVNFISNFRHFFTRSTFSFTTYTSFIWYVFNNRINCFCDSIPFSCNFNNCFTRSFTYRITYCFCNLTSFRINLIYSSCCSTSFFTRKC